MRVFLTGATGFIGTYLIPELLGAGHQVIGLSRSDEGAAKLQAAGVEVLRGTLEEPQSLVPGVEKADAVIHCAFDHNFATFAANGEKDKKAILTMGEALLGSDRPMLITSGVALGNRGDGKPATEDYTDTIHQSPRQSEYAGLELLEKGVNLGVVRLPQVHDTEKSGLIPYFAAIAKEKGVSGYLTSGATAWSAAHVTDVARLYKLAIERGEKGAIYNAVDESGVSFKEIAEVIGANLKVPVKAIEGEEIASFFGWMAVFAKMDFRATSEITQKKLGWTPTGPDLLSDLKQTKF
ncbi:SDR family oxidoreductase [Granulicella cerasi]|uniref:SDR family oxidoreductase n=1 Tax=Granulicella cerasi TaxID=741063 RepID=A0ABW1ZGQ0_9BACT|nr:SDR family oxidoreductase [Granulicella cerasi]